MTDYKKVIKSLSPSLREDFNQICAGNAQAYKLVVSLPLINLGLIERYVEIPCDSSYAVDRYRPTSFAVYKAWKELEANV